MSEKITIRVNDSEYYMNRNGGVVDDEGVLQVSASELDRIFETASLLKTVGKRLIEKAGHGHEVDFFGCDLGDVQIGCQHVDHATIVRVHKLSQAQRRATRRGARPDGSGGGSIGRS